MPGMGLGVWKIPPAATADAVYTALRLGWRALDCACDYGNEKEVGEGIARAIKDGLCTRADLFITSKLWCTFHEPARVEGALRRTLADLQLETIDVRVLPPPPTPTLPPHPPMRPPPPFAALPHSLPHPAALRGPRNALPARLVFRPRRRLSQHGVVPRADRRHVGGAGGVRGQGPRARAGGVQLQHSAVRALPQAPLPSHRRPSPPPNPPPPPPPPHARSFPATACATCCSARAAPWTCYRWSFTPTSCKRSLFASHRARASW